MHTMSATVDARPTADSERLDVLDAMRGFALAGIFLSNLLPFSGFAFKTPESNARERANPIVVPLPKASHR